MIASECVKNILTVFLIFTVLCVPFSSQQRDDGDGADNRMEMLRIRRTKEFLIKLKSMRVFNEYLVRGSRNYSVVALLNKSKKRNCHECLYAQDAIKYIALRYSEQFLKLEGPNRQPLFFVEIPEDPFKHLLRKMEVEHIPSLLFFPPEGMLSNLERFDSQDGMYDVSRISDFISKATKGLVRLDVNHIFEEDEEANKSNLMTTSTILVLLALAGAVLLLRKKISSTAGRFWNVGLTAYGIMTIVIILIGGHIYNHIEKPEFGSTNGLDSIFHSSFDYQFHIEAYFVSFIYFGVSFAFLQLVEGRRLILTKEKGGNIRSVFAALLAGGLLYLLNYVCELKNAYS